MIYQVVPLPITVANECLVRDPLIKMYFKNLLRTVVAGRCPIPCGVPWGCIVSLVGDGGTQIWCFKRTGPNLTQ